MKPVDFLGRTHMMAESQEEYVTLPVRCIADEFGTTTSCWKLSLRERLRVLFTGVIWHHTLTFGRSYPPTIIETEDSYK